MTKLGRDIEAAQAGRLRWNCENAAGSLDAVLQYVEDEAANAVNWYWRNKKWKSRLSRAIMFLAVVLTAAGGIVPIIGQLAGSETLKSGLWATLFVGLAAALLGLDKAFGFSSGWARFVLTATSIRKQLEEFRMDWTALRAASSPEPTPAQAEALIQRAKEFRIAVEALVLQETKEWVTEFQSNMARLEKDVAAQLDKLKAETAKAAQVQEAARQPGSIALSVPNADQADNAAIHVRLDGAEARIAEESLTGTKTWVRLNVAPGQYRIVVSGAISGRPVAAEGAVMVKPGEIARPEIALPL